MKIADLEIKDQEFGETTKEPGLVRSILILKMLIVLDIRFGQV